MIQRLGLAQALLNEPELLVLDEPSEGLDLEGRQILRDVLREQRQRGRTVLLVSHLLADVEQVCDAVGVLVAGRLIWSGPVAELTQGVAGSLETALSRLYAQFGGEASGQPAQAREARS
jgi:ABC-2 type transport system ATP-binding protein